MNTAEMDRPAPIEVARESKTQRELTPDAVVIAMPEGSESHNGPRPRGRRVQYVPPLSPSPPLPVPPEFTVDDWLVGPEAGRDPDDVLAEIFRDIERGLDRDQAVRDHLRTRPTDDPLRRAVYLSWAVQKIKTGEMGLDRETALQKLQRAMFELGELGHEQLVAEAHEVWIATRFAGDLAGRDAYIRSQRIDGESIRDLAGRLGLNRNVVQRALSGP